MKSNNSELSLANINNMYTPEVLLAMAEIQQARSNYQIEKFVINQHDTPQTQYQQCLIELQSLYYTIKKVSLELKKTEIEIERLRSTNDEIDEINAQIKELQSEETRLVGVGAFRELKKFLEIFESFDKKYTREEIEEDQANYWSKRLNRQSALEAIGGSPSQSAHLTSLYQTGEISISKEDVKIIENTKVGETE
jgi:hypothetical protein